MKPQGGTTADQAVEQREIAVVICTKDRTDELTRCLRSVFRQEPPADHVIVVDASRDDDARGAARHVARDEGRDITVVQHAPGLARQRNAAVDLVRERHPEVEIVAFFDDDSVLTPGCLAALRRGFSEDPRIGGVGGVVVEDKDLPTGLRGRVWRGLKRFFLLEGPPGRVLSSGRNIMVWDASASLDVQWLRGAAMAFRREALESERFDDRLTGYSWGEDFDLSFRVSQEWRLVVRPDARVLHDASEKNRETVHRLARARTVLLHAWVSEHRGQGVSLTAFWWSVLGEVVLQFLLGATARRRDALDQATGCLLGAVDILRSGSSRDVPL